MAAAHSCCLSSLPRAQGALVAIVHSSCCNASRCSARRSLHAELRQQTRHRPLLPAGLGQGDDQAAMAVLEQWTGRSESRLRASSTGSQISGEAVAGARAFARHRYNNSATRLRLREEEKRNVLKGECSERLWSNAGSFSFSRSSRLAARSASSSSVATGAEAGDAKATTGSAVQAPPTEPVTVAPPSTETNGAAGPAKRSQAYPFTEIEAKWQAYWEDKQTFRTPETVDTSKPKYYVLDMFPYPSGAGLHVGHPEGYTATDIVARHKRMKGYNVLHPMGWDAFGLPAEQYAIETGTHPRITTQRNIDRFRTQLKALGFSYDWQREISTTDPDYYKWTQWIFLQIFNRGLAYQANVAVNWCPALGTVLANEEVVDGLSERGGHPVIRKPMRQWMLRITAYADRLLEDLEDLNWPESIKEMQRNWIGRSEGAELEFKVVPGEGGEGGAGVRVFTTRPDTLCGATYLVLAPEHELVPLITTPQQRSQVEEYVDAASRKSDLERTELQKEKTGVDTGARARNPATGEDIPIWVADYVLGSYGTGAIMAVPAHDTRDFEFATEFGLPIRTVVQPPAGGGEAQAKGEAFSGSGVMVNSSHSASGLDLDGKCNAEAGKEVIAWLEAQGIGKKQVNFKLRDWLFARQRYWGEPFPLLLVPGEGGALGGLDSVAVPVPESELPVTLPEMDDFTPTGTGEPPLAKATQWLSTVDPSTGKPALRETNTMPQWAGSCWYYLRFMDPTNSQALVDPAKEKYWGPVDLYVGGAEHSVLHLLYARFWHKVLYDIGVVSTKEPFQQLINQGMILGEVEFTAYRDDSGAYVSADKASSKPCVSERVPEDEVLKKGEGYVLKGDPAVKVSARAHKMSKSRGNVVNPDDVVHEFGADSLRLYEMFMGPLRDTKIWSTKGVEGVHRFLARVWRLAMGTAGPTSTGGLPETGGLGGGVLCAEAEPTKEQLKAINQCIKKVSEELEGTRFNTAIAAMMEYVNQAYKWEVVPVAVFEPLVLLLNPFAPHVAEELWQRLGHTESVAYQPWPEADAAYLVEDTVKLPVQVNGKMRGVLEVEAGAGEAEVVALALGDPSLQRFFDGKQIKKQIFVPKKILNFIVV